MSTMKDKPQIVFQTDTENMGWCGSCFRFLGFALVPLIAILAFFQLECLAEKKNGEAQVKS